MALEPSVAAVVGWARWYVPNLVAAMARTWNATERDDAHNDLLADLIVRGLPSFQSTGGALAAYLKQCARNRLRRLIKQRRLSRSACMPVALREDVTASKPLDPRRDGVIAELCFQMMTHPERFLLTGDEARAARARMEQPELGERELAQALGWGRKRLRRVLHNVRDRFEERFSNLMSEYYPRSGGDR